MKAISLWQPWASLVWAGVKTIETRHWSTNYRGPLAIHAAKRKPTVDEAFLLPLAGLCASVDVIMVFAKQPLIPFGAVVATCDLVDVVPMVEKAPEFIRVGFLEERPDVESYLLLNGLNGHLWLWDGETAVNVESERPFGHYAPGRFGWILANVKALPEPIPAVGHQGLWNWSGEV